MVGTLYFIQICGAMGDPIKVGHTTRPISKRFREWELAMPFHDLKIIGTIEAPKDQETLVKKVFRKHMIRPKRKIGRRESEWFSPSADMLQYIERLTRC